MLAVLSECLFPSAGLENQQNTNDLLLIRSDLHSYNFATQSGSFLPYSHCSCLPHAGYDFNCSLHSHDLILHLASRTHLLTPLSTSSCLTLIGLFCLLTSTSVQRLLTLRTFPSATTSRVISLPSPFHSTCPPCYHHRIRRWHLPLLLR